MRRYLAVKLSGLFIGALGMILTGADSMQLVGAAGLTTIICLWLKH